MRHSAALRASILLLLAWCVMLLPAAAMASGFHRGHRGGHHLSAGQQVFRGHGFKNRGAHHLRHLRASERGIHFGTRRQGIHFGTRRQHLRHDGRRHHGGHHGHHGRRHGSHRRSHHGVTVVFDHGFIEVHDGIVVVIPD